jgi:hypothetical protein
MFVLKSAQVWIWLVYSTSGWVLLSICSFSKISTYLLQNFGKPKNDLISATPSQVVILKLFIIINLIIKKCFKINYYFKKKNLRCQL